MGRGAPLLTRRRSEEHTSELQSHSEIVCRLLLEKKNGLRFGEGRRGVPEEAAGPVPWVAAHRGGALQDGGHHRADGDRSDEFLFYGYGDHRDLHSFPTRRSSDLQPRISSAKCNSASFGNTPRLEAGTSSASIDRKSTRLNSSHTVISYAVFCL